MSWMSGSDALKGVAITAAVLVLWRIAVHLPIPGVDLQALSDFHSLGAGLRDLPGLGLLALGLSPYINASIVVEVFALFLNPLKAWRAGGAAGRLRLRRAAYIVTLAFALLQGYLFAGNLVDTIAPDGSPVMLLHGFAGKGLVALTLAGGTFFLLALAGLISRMGIGHGVSLLIFCGISSRIYGKFFSSARHLMATDGLDLIGDFGNFDRLLAILGGATLVFGSLYLLTAVEGAARRVDIRFPGGVKASLPLRLMPAGIVPASWALVLAMIPFTVMGFTNLRLPDDLMESLYPGGILNESAGLALIVVFSFFFTALFHRPARIIDDLEVRGAAIVVPAGEAVVKHLDRVLSFLALVGGLYLGLLVIAGNVAFHFLGLSLGAVPLLIAVAIALDLHGEGCLRFRHGPVVSVAEVHDVNRAALLADCLRVNGVPCQLRGYRHRALLYFFGPYVEMTLLVPEGSREEAERTIEKTISTSDSFCALADD